MRRFTTCLGTTDLSCNKVSNSYNIVAKPESPKQKHACISNLTWLHSYMPTCIRVVTNQNHDCQQSNAYTVCDWTSSSERMSNTISCEQHARMRCHTQDTHIQAIQIYSTNYNQSVIPNMISAKWTQRPRIINHFHELWNMSGCPTRKQHLTGSGAPTRSVHCIHA